MILLGFGVLLSAARIIVCLFCSNILGVLVLQSDNEQRVPSASVAVQCSKVAIDHWRCGLSGNGGR